MSKGNIIENDHMQNQGEKTNLHSTMSKESLLLPYEVLLEIAFRMEISEIFNLLYIDKTIYKSLTTRENPPSRQGMKIWQNAMEKCFPEWLYPKCYGIELNRKIYSKENRTGEINFYVLFKEYHQFFLGRLHKKDKALFLKAGYLNSISENENYNSIKEIFKKNHPEDRIGNRPSDLMLEVGSQFLLNSIYSEYKKLYKVDKSIFLVQLALLLKQKKEEVDNHISDKTEVSLETNIKYGQSLGVEMTGNSRKDALILEKYYLIVDALTKNGSSEHIETVFEQIDSFFFEFEYAKTEMRNYFLFSVIKFNKIGLLEPAIGKIGNVNKDLFVRDNHGYPLNNYSFPLMIAVAFGRKEIVKALLGYKEIDVNRCLENKTPLMIAARLGNLEIVQLLLKKTNINIEVMDSSNQSVVEYAFFSGNVKILEQLIEREDLPDEKKEKANRYLNSLKVEVHLLNILICQAHFLFRPIGMHLFSLSEDKMNRLGLRLENLKSELLEQLDNLVRRNCLELLQAALYQINPEYGPSCFTLIYKPRFTMANHLDRLFKKIKPTLLARAAVDLAFCLEKIKNNSFRETPSFLFQGTKEFLNNKETLIIRLLEGIRDGKLNLTENQVNFIHKEKDKKNSKLKDVLDIFDILKKELNFSYEKALTLLPENPSQKKCVIS